VFVGPGGNSAVCSSVTSDVGKRGGIPREIAHTQQRRPERAPMSTAWLGIPPFAPKSRKNGTASAERWAGRSLETTEYTRSTPDGGGMRVFPESDVGSKTAREDRTWPPLECALSDAVSHIAPVENSV